MQRLSFLYYLFVVSSGNSTVSSILNHRNFSRAVQHQDKRIACRLMGAGCFAFFKGEQRYVYDAGFAPVSC